MICPHCNKPISVIAEMNSRLQVNAMIAADKTGKADFINLMNAEFIQRHYEQLDEPMPEDISNKAIKKQKNFANKATPCGTLRKYFRQKASMQALARWLGVCERTPNDQR